MLRVNLSRLARRNPKKGSIKIFDSFDKSPTPGHRLTVGIGIGVVIIIRRPAAGRNLIGHIEAARDHTPKRFRVYDTTRKAAAETHDRHSFPRCIGCCDGLSGPWLQLLKTA